MADIFDAEKRSDIMRQVKSKKNKSTELRLIEIFKHNGITGWRRNYQVKGHPDFVFPKEKIAVFVDGCFWHGHDCRNTRPADHQEYWQKKRERNMKHDQEVYLSQSILFTGEFYISAATLKIAQIFVFPYTKIYLFYLFSCWAKRTFPDCETLIFPGSHEGRCKERL